MSKRNKRRNKIGKRKQIKQIKSSKSHKKKLARKSSLNKSHDKILSDLATVIRNKN